MRGPAERLEYGGVRLRRWRLTDADALYTVVADSLDHLAPWMAWAQQGYDRSDAADFLAQCDRTWRSGEAFNYAILAPDGSVVGSCGLMARAGPGGLEIGYWLRRDYTGRGLVTRATAALIIEAFRVGAEWVEIQHDTANVRSAAVPKRLGFTAVGERPADEPIAGPNRTGVNRVWRRTRDEGAPSTGD
jgi:ribosomal-protein-serine acetyltransferase